MASRIPGARVYTDGAMASTDTIYSSASNVDGLRLISYHASWTGTPTGAFTFWGSNKPNPSTADDTDWVDLDPATPPSDPAGSASKWLFDLVDYPYSWIRIKYVNASGTGVLNAYLTAKE